MSEEFVYLEDLAPPKGASKTTTTVTKASAAATTAKAGEKRQRSLLEFSKAKRVKTSTSPQKLGAIPFSLPKYRESLSEEERELLQLECETLNLVWLKMLKDEIRKPYFLNLKRFLRSEGLKAFDDPNPDKGLKVFPPAGDIYSWSRFTPLGRVRIVIIGQDPYHGPRQAHGLCFSVRRGITTPPSLVNMYKEIKTEYPDFEVPKHGNLEEWAKQGVLLLNSSLTVRPGAAASHSGKGWETFTEAVLQLVVKYGGCSIKGANGETTGTSRGIVFMAWGSHAQKCVAKILDKDKHLILTSAHPSPLSCHKGFFGNNHFVQANQWLKERYGPEGPVDWCKLDAQADDEPLASQSTTATTDAPAADP